MSSTNNGIKGGEFTYKLYFDPEADKPETDGYWITHDKLREKLSKLIDTSEKIKNASVYSNPLSSWQLTNWKWYHAFIVMETEDSWWSIEKDNECITIQRSKDLASVRDMFQRKKRKTGRTSLTSIRNNESTQGSNTTISELVNYIWRKDCLNDVYHLRDSNCQIFAAMVFDRIKSPHNDQVYFDQAADQPLPANSSCFMSVDKVLNEVQRLSQSDTISHLELYKFPLSSWKIPGLYVPLIFLCIFLKPVMMPVFITSAILYPTHTFLKHHYFVLFVTNNGTYWTFERLPTRFTIQRAKNKDILLKECQRESRNTVSSSSIKWIQKYPLSVEKDINTVMNFLWEKNELDHPGYLPGIWCSRVACEIYQHFDKTASLPYWYEDFELQASYTTQYYNALLWRYHTQSLPMNE